MEKAGRKNSCSASEGSNKCAAAMSCLQIIYIHQQQACCIHTSAASVLHIYIICMLSRKRAQLKLKKKSIHIIPAAVKRRSLAVLRLRAYLYIFFLVPAAGKWSGLPRVTSPASDSSSISYFFFFYTCCLQAACHA